MKCDLAALSAYLDGELPEAERSALARHVLSCSSCARVLASYRRISAELRALPAPPTPPSLDAALYERLDDLSRPVPFATALLRSLPGLASSAAVAVLLFVLAFLLRDFGGDVTGDRRLAPAAPPVEEVVVLLATPLAPQQPLDEGAPGVAAEVALPLDQPRADQTADKDNALAIAFAPADAGPVAASAPRQVAAAPPATPVAAPAVPLAATTDPAAASAAVADPTAAPAASAVAQAHVPTPGRSLPVAAADRAVSAGLSSERRMASGSRPEPTPVVLDPPPAAARTGKSPAAAAEASLAAPPFFALTDTAEGTLPITSPVTTTMAITTTVPGWLRQWPVGPFHLITDTLGSRPDYPDREAELADER